MSLDPDTNDAFHYIVRAAHLQDAIHELELIGKKKDEVEEMVRQAAIKMLTDRKRVIFYNGWVKLNEHAEANFKQGSNPGDI